MIRFVVSVAVAAALTASAAYAQGSDSEDKRYQFNQVADGYLRLDLKTGQVSLCNRRDIGWSCVAVADDRAAFDSEIARLQGENATMKKELLSRGLPVPGVSAPSGAKPGEGELKLPSDAEVDRVVSFLEKVWRRLIEMGRNVQKDVEKKN